MIDEVANDEALEGARAAGRQAAELVELRLREVETEQREQRLAELAWRPQSNSGSSQGSNDSVQVVQLEARVSELTAYVKAVNESRPWRAIQWFRRKMGRSW